MVNMANSLGGPSALYRAERMGVRRGLRLPTAAVAGEPLPRELQSFWREQSRVTHKSLAPDKLVLSRACLKPGLPAAVELDSRSIELVNGYY